MKRIILALLLILAFVVHGEARTVNVVVGQGVAAGGGTPTLSSATIGTSGKTVTLVFSESVTVGAGGNAGWTITPSVNTATMTYASGSGSDTLVYNLNTFICNTETFSVSYTQPGNGIEATTGGGDVATIASSAGTNNSTVPLPDVWYKCEDNAANNTVTATYGSNGGVYLSGDPSNTNSNTSTTAFTGSRSYAPSGDTGFITSGALTEASLDDGAFTVQFAYRADNTSGFPSSAWVRFILDPVDETQFVFGSNAGSSTSFWLMVGGGEFFPTLDEVNTGSWQVIRIVVNTGATNKVTVYQGSSETGLSSKFNRTDATTSPNFGANPTWLFGGNGASPKSIQVRNGLMDDIKIWYTAVIP